MFDDDFDDMFALKYESFLINDEPEYDVFEFDDLCFTTNCMLDYTSESTSEVVSLLLLLN